MQQNILHACAAQVERLRTQLEAARGERERLQASVAALQAELAAAQAQAAQLGRELSSSKRRSQDGGLADAAAAADAATSEAFARLAEEAGPCASHFPLHAPWLQEDVTLAGAE